jgi:phosphorylcholine metabolism protein LicD
MKILHESKNNCKKMKENTIKYEKIETYRKIEKVNEKCIQFLKDKIKNMESELENKYTEKTISKIKNFIEDSTSDFLNICFINTGKRII